MSLYRGGIMLTGVEERDVMASPPRLFVWKSIGTSHTKLLVYAFALRHLACTNVLLHALRPRMTVVSLRPPEHLPSTTFLGVLGD